MKNLGTIKKFSLYKIVCLISIVVLLIVVVVQIGVMINLKTKIQDTSNQNQELVSILDDE